MPNTCGGSATRITAYSVRRFHDEQPTRGKDEGDLVDFGIGTDEFTTMFTPIAT